MTADIQNNFESKVSMKIETNSRGFNTVVHVYQGVSKKEIDETVPTNYLCTQSVTIGVNREG